MRKDSYGHPGGGGGGSEIIIPVGGSEGTRRVFPHILDAISQIQQFYVIEASGQEIPDDFLTLRGKLNFFNVGFGAGFFEALIFTLLLSVTLVIVSDDAMRQAIARFFPLINNDLFLWMTNLLPVIISGALCSYLSRFYIGRITKKSIDAFLIGRVFSMGLKGVIIFFLLLFASDHIDSNSAWTVATWLSFEHYDWAIQIYYTLMAMQPLLIERAFGILAIFSTAVVMPFLFIWGVAIVRNTKSRIDRAKVNS